MKNKKAKSEMHREVIKQKISKTETPKTVMLWNGSWKEVAVCSR